MLYFVIDEKNRSIELTDKGIDVLTGKTDDPTFFILPDITTQLAELENENISDEEKAEKKSQYAQNYAIKAERVHTVNQLLKAYTLFDRDIEYVIDDGKSKLSTSRQDVSWKAAATATVCTKPSRRKRA